MTSQLSFCFSCDTLLIKLSHDGLSYEPGDHLAVFPANSAEQVNTLCDSCFFDEGIDKETPVALSRHKPNDNRDGERSASMLMSKCHWLNSNANLLFEIFDFLQVIIIFLVNVYLYVCVVVKCSVNTF